MTTKEDLEKMTVAQIKEKLKSRKLPSSGAKSDLITRLFESLITEEKLLEEADLGPGGDNIDLSNVNLDEVLGLDDEKDSAVSSASDPKPNDSLLSLGSPESASEKSRNTTTETKKLDSPLKKKHPQILTAESREKPEASAAKEVQPKQQPETAAGGDESATDDETDNKAQPIDQEKKVQIKMAARLGVPLAESEAKAKRAARFNSNGTTTTAAPTAAADEEGLKAKRASRFGLASPTADDATKRKPSEEDGKMLKRAERFGLPLKRGANDSADSKLNSSPAVAEELLQKRAKRFGSALSSDGNEDSKKVTRAKRFGLT